MLEKSRLHMRIAWLLPFCWLLAFAACEDIEENEASDLPDDDESAEPDDDDTNGDPIVEPDDDDDDLSPPEPGEAFIRPVTVVAGANERFIVVFTARRTIHPGGGVIVTFNPSQSHLLSCPINTNTERTCGLVRVECTDPTVQFEVGARYGSNIFGVKLAHVTVTITAGELEEGDRLVVVYGAGSEKTYVPEIAMDVEATVQVKTGALKRWREIDRSPVLTVTPLAPVKLLSAVDYEAKQLRLSLLDEYGNLCTQTAGTAEASMLSENMDVVYRASTPVTDGRAQFALPALDGRYFIIRSRVPELHLHSRTPYVLTDHRVFFGDPHLHTKCSDALFAVDPVDVYAYARDAALLDFAVVADHAEFVIFNTYLTRYLIRDIGNSWRYLKRITNLADDLGFPTLVAFESTISGYQHPRDGHHNVYYRNDDGPLYVYDKWTPQATHISSTQDLCEKLDAAGEEALVIPHHTLRPDILGSDFAYYHPERMRLVEIYSQHGCNESPDCPRTSYGHLLDPEGLGSVQRAIGPLSYRMGFIGGSDNHTGHPAGSGMEDTVLSFPETYPGGLTAVIADELTRETLWDALYRRSVYATTGERIYLEFFINDRPMGSELVDQQQVSLAARAIGVQNIAKAEIVKYSASRGWETILTQKPHSPFWSTARDDSLFRENSLYYLRVTQNNGAMAWSSPIWVDYAE